MQVYDPRGNMCLDVSLFERLVNGELPVHSMLVQRRLRPQISELIRRTIYPELRDGVNVLDYPHVSGDYNPVLAGIVQGLKLAGLCNTILHLHNAYLSSYLLHKTLHPSCSTSIFRPSRRLKESHHSK